MNTRLGYEVGKEYKFFDSSYIAPYEDYVDNCDANDIEADAENSSDYWDYVNDVRELDRDCFFEEIENIAYNGYCLIEGSCGLWWGRRTIIPVMCSSLTKAINKCWGNCNDIEVTFQDGVFFVNAYHHDGINAFTIKRLSSRGIERFEKLNQMGDAIEPKEYWFKKYKLAN